MQKRGQKDFKTFLEETYGQNLVHPLAGLIFFTSLVWAFCAPRKYLIWPVIMIACFISPAQRFAILGLDFHFLRAITLMLLVRILIFRDLKDVRLGKADLALTGLVAAIVLGTLARGGINPAMTTAGKMIELFCLYFIGRALIRNLDDVRGMLLGVGLLAVPVGISFIVEQYTRYNFFSLFGGIPEMTVMRDGKLRSQGSFAHPIIAGVFWASFAPMFMAQIFAKQQGFMNICIGWVGFIMCCICAFMTNSSTSIAGILVGLTGWCFYKFRNNLRMIFWITMGFAFIIHMASTRGFHGVIFTRISFISASTGYHRYMLFEGLFNNVPKWFFIGTNNRMFNRSFIDVTNQYILIALDGGIIALVLQLSLIEMGFKAVGRALKASVKRADTLLIFGVGVGYLVAIISFTAVSAYGEAVIPLYMILGIMISLGDPGTVMKSFKNDKTAENDKTQNTLQDSNSRKTPFTGRARG